MTQNPLDQDQGRPRETLAGLQGEEKEKVAPTASASTGSRRLGVTEFIFSITQFQSNKSNIKTKSVH